MEKYPTISALPASEWKLFVALYRLTWGLGGNCQCFSFFILNLCKSDRGKLLQKLLLPTHAVHSVFNEVLYMHSGWSLAIFMYIYIITKVGNIHTAQKTQFFIYWGKKNSLSSTARKHCCVIIILTMCHKVEQRI